VDYFKDHYTLTYPSRSVQASLQDYTRCKIAVSQLIVQVWGGILMQAKYCWVDISIVCILYAEYPKCFPGFCEEPKCEIFIRISYKEASDVW